LIQPGSFATDFPIPSVWRRHVGIALFYIFSGTLTPNLKRVFEYGGCLNSAAICQAIFPEKLFASQQPQTRGTQNPKFQTWSFFGIKK
jgi:hypothetical protein